MKITRWWCMLDIQNLLERKNKRNQWMERYINTVPKFKYLMEIKAQTTQALIENQYKKLGKNSLYLNNSIIKLRKKYKSENSRLSEDNNLLRKKLKANISIEISNNKPINPYFKKSPPIVNQLVRIKAKDLVFQLNVNGIPNCILAKDCTVRVNSNIVIICAGHSKTYTGLIVKDQNNWDKDFMEFFRSNSLDESVEHIKKKLVDNVKFD